MKKVLMLCAVLLLSVPMTVLASPVSATVSTSVTASEVDECLTQLEKVIDEYALLVPKVKAGDAEATMQLANLSIKMSKLAEKLADSKENMNEQQLARYAAIIAKMSAALI